MVSTRYQRSFAASFVLLIFVCLSGCGESNVNNPANKTTNIHGMDKVPPESKSANYLLDPGDYKYFTVGRSRTEILNDVQWRGNFLFAVECEGKRITVIEYGVLGGRLGNIGDVVDAIFVEEKFEKFVHWPREEAETRLGDCGMPIRLLECDSVNIENSDKEAREQAERMNKGLDPGIAIIRYLLKPGREARLAPIPRRNAELRDQYNAARLKLGMRPSEVQAVFKAAPIESGVAGANSYEIYGSTESVSALFDDERYSNVLLVLRDGQVTGIYSGWWVPGGADGLREMRQRFVDLPAK